MTKPAPHQKRSTAMLLLLFAVAIVGPVMPSEVGAWHVPHWLGGVVALAALLGFLGNLWRQGALKGIYLAAFVVTIGVAALVGLYLSEHT